MRRLRTALLVLSACPGAALAGDDADKDARFQATPLPAHAVSRIGALPRGHVGAVLSVAVPDGAMIVSAGEDGTVRFWDRRTGAHRSVLSVMPRFEAAALAPDAVRVGGVHVFTVQFVALRPFERPWARRQLAVEPTCCTPTCMTFSPDGRYAVWTGAGGGGEYIAPDSAEMNGTISEFAAQTDARVGCRVWIADVVARGPEVVFGTLTWDGAALRRMRPHGESDVTALQSWDDGRFLVTGCESGEYAVWKQNVDAVWRAGGDFYVLSSRHGGDGRPVRALAVSADGGALAVADDVRIRVCDMKTGVEKTSTKTSAVVRCVAWSADHRVLVAGLDDGGIDVFDVKAALAGVGEPRRLGRPATALADLDVSTRADEVVVVARDALGGFLVSRSSSKSGETVAPDEGGRRQLAVSRDGAFILRADAELLHLDSRSGETRWTVSLAGIRSARYSRDGASVAVVDAEGAVRVLAADTGVQTASAPPGLLLWRAAPGHFAAPGATGRVRVLDMEGSVQDSSIQFLGASGVAAMSASGLWTCAYDGRTPQITLRRKGEVTANLALGEGFEAAFSSIPTAVAFSDRDEFVVVALRDGRVLAWDVETGKRAARYDADVGAVTAVAFVPGTTRLVSASTDGTCLVWEALKTK